MLKTKKQLLEAGGNSLDAPFAALQGNFRLFKFVCFFPCWVQRESITTGNIFIFSRGLKQVEVNQPQSMVPLVLDLQYLGHPPQGWSIDAENP